MEDAKAVRDRDVGIVFVSSTPVFVTTVSAFVLAASVFVTAAPVFVTAAPVFVMSAPVFVTVARETAAEEPASETEAPDPVNLRRVPRW